MTEMFIYSMKILSRTVKANAQCVSGKGTKEVSVAAALESWVSTACVGKSDCNGSEQIAKPCAVPSLAHVVVGYTKEKSKKEVSCWADKVKTAGSDAPPIKGKISVSRKYRTTTQTGRIALEVYN